MPLNELLKSRFLDALSIITTRINNMKRILISFFLIGLTVLLPFCGRSVKSGSGDSDSLLGKARKNIMTAESFSDLRRRNELLKAAESQLKEAEIADQKGTSKNEIASYYAYFYFVNGDYLQAKKYAEKNSDKNDPFITILNVRIMLKEKGKESAKNALGILETILGRSERNAMGILALGDCQFMLGNFQEAQRHYTEVLKIGEAFQVQAADRLEVMDQIKRSGIETSKVQNIILSQSVRRDEMADLLQRVLNADKHLKFGKADQEFGDISDSLYVESIRLLRAKGFFSYITGEKFEPFRPVSRGEMAKVIEDYIVLKNGNTSLRAKYANDVKPAIKGIDVKDPYYNALRTAVDAKIMDISLDGSVNPLDPISGLETLNTFSKLIK
jgi:tetratricopeptide (TPR) repeat protein